MAVDLLPCVMCGSTEAKLCVSCRSVSYCGRSCQKEDWRVHKILCSKIQEAVSKQPTPAHRLAILLPEDEDKPKLVWIDHSEGGFQQNLELQLGEADPHSTVLKCNERAEREMDHKLVLRSQAIYAGGYTNRCITTLIAALKPHEYQGTILAMAQQHGSEDYSDVTLEDLRVLIDHFIALDFGLCIDIRATGELPEDFVRAVRISCYGDQKALGEPTYKAVGVRKDCINFLPRSATIPSHLGLPVAIKRLRPDPDWMHDEKFFNRYDNLPATWLHINDNPESGSWGWAPPIWQSEVGSVLVAREDGRDISPLQVEALCDYCQRVLGGMFETSVESGRKEPVLRALTTEAFRRSFEEYKADRIAGDARWIEEHFPVESV